MIRFNRIKQKLDVLKPHYLELNDESHLHRGHPGVMASRNNSDETHFKIKICSPELKGKSLVSQHRIIQQLLKEEFESGLHALSIKII